MVPNFVYLTLLNQTVTYYCVVLIIGFWTASHDNMTRSSEASSSASLNQLLKNYRKTTIVPTILLT